MKSSSKPMHVTCETRAVMGGVESSLSAWFQVRRTQGSSFMSMSTSAISFEAFDVARSCARLRGVVAPQTLSLSGPDS
jgi:hypothetical protein